MKHLVVLFFLLLVGNIIIFSILACAILPLVIAYYHGFLWGMFAALVLWPTMFKIEIVRK